MSLVLLMVHGVACATKLLFATRLLFILLLALLLTSDLQSAHNLHVQCIRCAECNTFWAMSIWHLVI